MSDNKILKDQRDRTKVNSQEPNKVEDLHQKYPHLSHQTVSDAVKKHGPDKEKIETYLDGFWKDK
jgi:Protein of unknown function (DUF3606)